jgi:hypothetical protein
MNVIWLSHYLNTKHQNELILMCWLWCLSTDFLFLSFGDSSTSIYLITFNRWHIHVYAGNNPQTKCAINHFCLSLHGVITLLGFCRRYGVHYRLLSICVGSFTCPGIDVRYKGPRFLVSSDRPYLYCIPTTSFLYVHWPGSNALTDPFRIVSQA